LLSGPPGTGKTMAAGLIARELGLDLYQADLSKMVSKYIGETAKQLGLLFDTAETGHAIILFDEADSLFGKRSEVRSSNDRYANMSVNYLLQRIEQFTGIALLTSNHESNIDDAFRRRLSAHVKFATPDEPARAALWAAMMPSQVDILGQLNTAALAREFNLSGGYIRNAVLRAAYLAAQDGTALTMSHLRRAARMECETLGQVLQSR
jgi:SpoVK/Ycf46/Vps4 family AAA+-type ATPase